MTTAWAFLPMRSSTDLLGDATALRERLDQDSYLLFRGLLDPDKITKLRRAVTNILVDAGWIHPAVPIRARAIVAPIREEDEGYAAAYDRIQQLEPFHEMAHDEALTEAMCSVLGDTAFPHPLKIARLAFPGPQEIATPPHQDFPNNQGTENLTATWVPLGEVPAQLGSLAILRGSHRYGVFPLGRHLGPGNRTAIVPVEVQEDCRWVTTDFEPGDVLVFGSQTVHASLPNASEAHMRLSVDFRWQLEGEALTPGCLEPHFGRLSWEEIYRGWSDRSHRYYWRDLEYETVPYDGEMIGADEASSAEEVAELLRYEQRLRARLERASG